MNQPQPQNPGLKFRNELGDIRDEIERVLRAGKEFSPPSGPGFWRHGADLPARPDVGHQDRPFPVDLPHKTEGVHGGSSPPISARLQETAADVGRCGHPSGKIKEADNLADP